VISNKDSNGADGSSSVEAKPEAAIPAGSGEKRPFVEPSISLPVDVLEATAFFLAVTVEAGTIS
jgi:hypothetical protein